MTDDQHHTARSFALSSGWVLILVLPILLVGLWKAVDYSTDQSNARIEKKFKQAIALSDAKHQQALHAQSVLFAYSINKSVCGFRSLVDGARKSALQTRTKYAALTRVEREKNEQTIKRLEGFLATQVTAPSGFKCETLPKKPPKVSAP